MAYRTELSLASTSVESLRPGRLDTVGPALNFVPWLQINKAVFTNQIKSANSERHGCAMKYELYQLCALDYAQKTWRLCRTL